MDEAKTPEQIADEESTRQAEADQKLNAVVKSHIRRELKAFQAQLDGMKNGLDTTITNAVQKAFEGIKPATDESAKRADGKMTGDPQVKLLLEKQEKMARELQEERERARGLETKARKSAVRSQLKEALEAKGIKGARLAALITHLEATSIKEDEQGNPLFTVSRSRAKGQPIEALEFDLIAGVEDWAKTTEAADFLPPPQGQTSDRRAQPGLPTGPRKQAPKYDRPAASDNEMIRRTAEQLAARGVDVTSILNE